MLPPLARAALQLCSFLGFLVLAGLAAGDVMGRDGNALELSAPCLGLKMQVS